MKRSVSSILASTLILGSTMMPVAWAGTSPTYNMQKKAIDLNGKVVTQPMGFAAKDPSSHVNTTYMPVWYVLYTLKKLNFDYTWDSKKNYLNVIPPTKLRPNFANIKVGSGNVKIAISGRLVISASSITAKDPYTGHNTTFIPIFYIKSILTRVGIKSTWDGKTWNLSTASSTSGSGSTGNTGGTGNKTGGNGSGNNTGGNGGNNNGNGNGTGNNTGGGNGNASGGTTQTSNVSSLSIAGTPTIGTGQADALSVTATFKNGTQQYIAASDVQWSVDDSNDSVITQGGQFLATKPGNYTVTAKYQGVSQTYKVAVYGNTAQIQLVAAGPVVADGQGTQTIHITAYDTAGNVVQNENGSVTISDTQSWLVTGHDANGNNTTGNSVTVQLKNGQGDVLIQAPTTPGVSDSISSAALNDVSAGATVSYGTLSVSSVAQVATALKVTPTDGEQYLVANQGGNTAKFSVTVVDQNGAPMETGSYGYNISVSGAADYVGAASGVYIGGTQSIPIVVASKQGVTGSVTVTATAANGQNLQQGSSTIQAVIAQNASKFLVQPISGTTFTFPEGGTATVSLTPVDPNGYPTSAPSTPLTVYVANQQGQAAGNIVVNGSAEGNNGVPLASGQGLTMSDNRSGADAGAYTVTIKDSSGNIWANFTVQETAGPASQLSLTTADTEVATANPTTRLTLAYTDAYGNPAGTTASSSVTVTATGGQGTATINGQDATKGVKLVPSSNGTVTALFTAQAYAGSTWYLTATDGSLNAKSLTITVLSALVTRATVTMNDTANGGSQTQASAGDALQITFGAVDSLGNAYNGNDVFAVKFPAGSLNGVNGGTTANGYTTVSGTLTQLASDFAGARVAAAQTLTLQIVDTSISNSQPGVATINVVPGKFAGFAVFTASGQLVSNNNQLQVLANTPVQVLIRPVDGYGNPVGAAPASNVVDLLDGGSGGSFRTTPVGANLNQVTIPAGQGQVSLYYVNNAGSYDLTASVSQVSAGSSTVKMGAFTAYTSGKSGTGTLTVTLKDQNGLPITGAAGTISAVASAQGIVIGPFTESSPGTYTATVTSSQNNTGATIKVTADGMVIGSTDPFNS